MANFLALKASWARRSAALGGVVWLLLFLLKIGDSPETALIQRIVLLGVLVVVPLALSLLPAPRSEEQNTWLYKTAMLSQPFGAIAVVASFLLEPGVPAAVLAFLWFFVTAVIALFGLWRLGIPEFRSAAEISISAGLIYLPVGGGWLVVSRLGVQLLGYGDTIILLTAVHFTFAAYAAPILSGLAGRRLREYSSVGPVFRLTPIGIIAGMPLVAAGITFSPVMALVGALMISIGLVLLAVLVVGWIVPSTRSLPAQVLLLISSASSLPAMGLACVYAYSIVFQQLLIDIPQMAMTHGLLNAFGFTLCGLFAWLILDRDKASSVTR